MILLVYIFDSIGGWVGRVRIKKYNYIDEIVSAKRDLAFTLSSTHNRHLRCNVWLIKNSAPYNMTDTPICVRSNV